MDKRGKVATQVQVINDAGFDEMITCFARCYFPCMIAP